MITIDESFLYVCVSLYLTDLTFTFPLAQENYTEALEDRLTRMGSIIISEITGGLPSDQVNKELVFVGGGEG